MGGSHRCIRYPAAGSSKIMHMYILLRFSRICISLLSSPVSVSVSASPSHSVLYPLSIWKGRHCPHHRPAGARRPRQRGRHLAVEKTVILLHPPLPSAGVSIVMERERQQINSPVNGCRHRSTSLRRAVPTRRRDCHSADALSPPLLKHQLKLEGGCSRIEVSATASSAAFGKTAATWAATSSKSSTSLEGPQSEVIRAV